MPDTQHTIIIAEAGVNHNGDIDMARRLVEVAARAGADYVKFQTFKADRLVTASARMAEYQQANTGECDSQYNMLKRLELSEADHAMLVEHCRRCGIGFLSTAFDSESADMLHSLGATLWKIPSGEITNYPYLRKIASFGQPVILSTGMCSMDDVHAAVATLEKFGIGRPMITILHCNTQYPTPYADVNLRAMLSLRDEFSVRVGYSDHTPGIEVPIAAVAMGASVIEKHFTLDRSLPGPDHKASLSPDELTAMVASIRHIEAAMGDGVKHVTPSEAANISVARKSIVAARDIAADELLTEENLTVKRPGTGVSPMLWEQAIGTRATRDYAKDEQITL